MCMAMLCFVVIDSAIELFVHETKKKTTQKSQNHVCRNIFLPPFSLMRKFTLFRFVYVFNLSLRLIVKSEKHLLM